MHSVVKAGTLSKKGEVRRNWNTRYFVLKPKYLFYFKSEDDRKLKGTIHLSNCCVGRDLTETKKSFVLTINCRGRTYFVSCGSEAELREWSEAISSCIENIVDQSTFDSSKRMSVSQAHLHGQDTADVRLRAVQEQIASEHSYLQLLTQTQSYRFGIETDTTIMSKITRDEVSTVFSCVNELVSAHTRLVQALESIEARWPEKPVGIMFLRLLPSFNVYKEYSSKYSASQDTLKELQKTHASLKTFLVNFQKKGSSTNTLEYLLQLPLKRMNDYVEFLSGYHMHTPDDDPDHGNLAMAIENMRHLFYQIDHENVVATHMAQLIDISRRVQGIPNDGDDALPQKHRRLLREGIVRLGPGPGFEREEEYYAWLCNDVIVYAKKSLGITSISLGASYKYAGRIDLCSISSVEPNASGGSDSLLLNIRSPPQDARPPESIQMAVESSRDRMSWLSDLSMALDFTAQRRVFGMPLRSIMAQESQAGRDIPSFVEVCTEWITAHGLDVEGIFRISGRKLEMQAVQNRLDQGLDVEFPPETEPHVVAGVLKLWFRELPEPLLTYALYDEFMNAMGLEYVEERMASLKIAIAKLSLHNQNLLQHMVSFLVEVAKHEDRNKMTSRNISIVFAPTFLSPEGSLGMDPNSLKQVYLVVEDFIANYAELFSDIQERRRRAADLQRQLEQEAASALAQKQEAIRRLIQSGGDETSASAGPAAYADPLLKQGFLSKKGGNRRNWTTRWFMLKRSCLLYFKSPTEINGMPKGKIIISMACIFFPWPKKNFGLCIYSPEQDRIYYICAKNMTELNEWLEEFAKVMTFAQTTPAHLLKRVE